MREDSDAAASRVRKMAGPEQWGEWRNCGQQVREGSGVQVEVRNGSTTKSTVLCPECATLSREDCGSPVPLHAALDEAWVGGTQILICSRCQEAVLVSEMVELQRKHDPTKLRSRPDIGSSVTAHRSSRGSSNLSITDFERIREYQWSQQVGISLISRSTVAFCVELVNN